MVIREIPVKTNLSGFGLPHPIAGVLFGGEDQAHRFIVSREDGEALSGTVSAKFLRQADNATVPLVGSIVDGAAVVTLNANCYYKPGRFTLTVYAAGDGSTTAIYSCTGGVARTDGDTTVDPSGEITIDVAQLIEDIAEATAGIPADYSSLLSTIAPTFSASTAYAAGKYVWYDGTLYRFTADHAAGSWTGSDAAAAVIGNDIADLTKNSVTMRTNLTASDDLNNMRQAGIYYKGSNVAVGNGVNANEARVLMFNKPDAGGQWAVAQLWFDTIDNELYFRTAHNSTQSFSAWKNVATAEETMMYRRALTSSDDANNILQTGVYFKDSSVDVANYPTASGSRMIVFDSNSDTNRYTVVQFVVGYASNSSGAFFYYRSTDNTSAHVWSPWKQVGETVSALTGRTETGTMSYDTTGNGSLANNTGAYFSRSEMVYECTPKSLVTIEFPSAQFAQFDRFDLITYDAQGQFLRSVYYGSSALTNPMTYRVASDCKYLKIMTHTAANKEHRETFVISSNEPLIERPNFNINSASISGSLAFVYSVARDARTSGRLILPPNYSITGDPVPMIVYAHGSGSMTSWDAEMANSERKQELFEYLADEGFAVFDCYPWTNRKALTITGNYGIYSPYAIPVILESYLKGIDYVCSRFNVDHSKVSLICKSQGGHIGHWAVSQSAFPFKAVCLQAPDTGLGRSHLLYDVNARRALLQYAEIDATQAEIDDFISSGDMANANVASLVRKNLGLFLSMLPSAQGVVNGSADEFYADLGAQGTTSIPAWMQDLGFPASVEYSGTWVPAFASHGDYIKKATCPSKFWCAYDDTAVSSYGVYAIYHWMLNGAAPTSFRVMPAGTGGHASMDTDENALVESGTTALGIQYTDIAAGFVEAVEFIRQCMGD